MIKQEWTYYVKLNGDTVNGTDSNHIWDQPKLVLMVFQNRDPLIGIYFTKKKHAKYTLRLNI